MTKPRCIVFGSGNRRACNRLQLRWHAGKGRHLNATPTHTQPPIRIHPLQLGTIAPWCFFGCRRTAFLCMRACVRVFGALVQVNKCKLTPTANVEDGDHDVDRKKFGCWKSWRTDWLYAYMRGYVCGQISVVQRRS